MRFVVAMLLLIPGIVSGQTIKVPPEIKGEASSFIPITPETDCEWVACRPCHPDLKIVSFDKVKDKGIGLIVPDPNGEFKILFIDDPKTAVVYSKKPGVYTLTFFGANKMGLAKPVDIKIVIGEPPPEPPKPVPPTPIPPMPDDPLAKDLVPLFAALPADEKILLPKLSALYRVGATKAKDPTVLTALQLVKSMQDGSGVLTKDKLVSIRIRLQAEISKIMPDASNDPLTADQRDKLANLFTRIATILETLK